MLEWITTNLETSQWITDWANIDNEWTTDFVVYEYTVYVNLISEDVPYYFEAERVVFKLSTDDSIHYIETEIR